jgi:uncharacterized phage protein gp47/JayE
MKSVIEIINSIKSNLKLLNSPLAATPEYSNAYLLFRSVAQEISRQYTDLNDFYLNSFLNSASGDNLDARARDFNVYRAEGTNSSGYVYATNLITIVIPKGAILNTATSNYQFQTTEESSLTPTGNYIPISAIVSTELANLNAGTILTSPFYPTVKFIVANSIDLNGNYLGGLAGGKSPESDNQFRVRVFSQINNQSKGTLEAVISKLQQLNLSKFFIKESYPIPGYFTVYVGDSDQRLIDIIEENLMAVKPVGVAFEIKTISSYPIDLRFVITLDSIESTETVVNRVKQLTYNYFNSLSLGQELYPINLAALASGTLGIVDIKVVNPSETKIAPPVDTLLTLRNLEFTINSGGY